MHLASKVFRKGTSSVCGKALTCPCGHGIAHALHVSQAHAQMKHSWIAPTVHGHLTGQARNPHHVPSRNKLAVFARCAWQMVLQGRHLSSNHAAISAPVAGRPWEVGFGGSHGASSSHGTAERGLFLQRNPERPNSSSLYSKPSCNS